MADERDPPGGEPPPGFSESASVHDLETERKKRKPRAKAALRPSDEELSQQFASDVVYGWRYVPDWDRMMMWTGKVWLRDELKRFFYEARLFCREVANSLTEKEAHKVLSSATYRNVVRMAQCDPALTVAIDDWDGTDDALNCDGMLYKFDGTPPRQTIATDFVTKSTTVQPGGECPKWLAFLELITGGDAELVGYIQRMCGYCLTGSTAEQVLFFLWGPGGNGKSTFINTIVGVMGDYAINAPMDMMAAAGPRGDHHPTELARLQGARLVTAAETAEGRRWDETRLKQLTGGDMVTARFMNKDFFDFLPVFKLLVTGNHKPELRGIDDAIKRRVHIIPFVVAIPPEQRILGFDEELRDEWSGILAWMIAGTEWWHTEGLKPPQAVLDATAEYFEAEDTVGMWLEERTMLSENPEHFVSSQQFFNCWVAYCKENGEHAGTRKKLSANLKKRSELHYHMRNGVRGFMGRSIKDEFIVGTTGPLL